MVSLPNTSRHGEVNNYYYYLSIGIPTAAQGVQSGIENRWILVSLGGQFCSTAADKVAELNTFQNPPQSSAVVAFCFVPEFIKASVNQSTERERERDRAHLPTRTSRCPTGAFWHLEAFFLYFLNVWKQIFYINIWYNRHTCHTSLHWHGC